MPSVAIIGTRGYPSYYGGFETAVRHLAPYLVEAGWDVTVYGRRAAVRRSDAQLDERVRSVLTPGVNSRSLSTLTYGLTSTLHALAHRPDVVLVMNVANGFWLPVFKLVGIPTIVNVDGIEWTRQKWGTVAKWVFRTGAKLTARFADELVFDARAIGRYWEREFSREGTWIPYGAVDGAPHSLQEDLDPGEYVLAVARLVPENTIHEFLDAAEVLSRTRQVVLVGSSGYGGELEERARALALKSEKFTWLGHIHDDRRLFALWKHAGVYFHGHSVGGTNPALVQAMMLGAPTVARDTEFNREVLGEAGKYAAPHAESIAGAIQHVLGDKEERMRLSTRGQSRARRHYTWAEVNAAYERLLRDALDGSQ